MRFVIRRSLLAEFHHKISLLIARVTRLSEHGGDRKSQEYKNQAGLTRYKYK